MAELGAAGSPVASFPAHRSPRQKLGVIGAVLEDPAALGLSLTLMRRRPSAAVKALPDCFMTTRNTMVTAKQRKTTSLPMNQSMSQSF